MLHEWQLVIWDNYQNESFAKLNEETNVLLGNLDESCVFNSNWIESEQNVIILYYI